MRLDGDLAAFGLPAVVSLLATSHQTGALVLTRPGPVARRGAIWFRDGYVVAASADLALRPLARRVVLPSRLDARTVAQAVDGALSGGHGVVRRLVDAGSVDPAAARDAATDVTVEAVAELLGWREGQFSIDPVLGEPDDVGVVLVADELLQQARARAEVWAQVSAAIPGPGTVLGMPLVPGEDPRVGPDEWAALSLVDGRRTVGEVIALTGAGPARVLPVLAGLVRRGLLVRVAVDSVDPLAATGARLEQIERLEAVTVGEDVATGAAPARAGAARPLAPLPGAQPDPGVPHLPAPLPDPVVVADPPALPAPAPSTGAVALAVSPVVERDPAVNRSLLLRLIAGVRGL